MDPSSDNRSEGRSNVFLSAALNMGTELIAVRIRNLSAHGALVEASTLPPVGSPVRLMRGSLQADGELVWKGAGQGGITFARNIDPEHWVKRVGHGGQRRVDGVMSALRGLGNIPPEASDVHNEQSIETISSALDQVCDELAATPGMSIELGEKLLRLDTIAQSLRRLATGKPF